MPPPKLFSSVVYLPFLLTKSRRSSVVAPGALRSGRLRSGSSSPSSSPRSDRIQGRESVLRPAPPFHILLAAAPIIVTTPDRAPPPPDDPDAASSAGEPASATFDDLFRANYPALVRFAYRMVGSRDTAEEIVQEVFLNLWRRRHEVDPTSVARAYLFTATRYGAVSWIRRARVERELLGADEASPNATHGSAEVGAGEAVELSDLDAAIEAAIAALPERCRLVYTLNRREHLSYAAVAAALGLSVKTVEAQMARAFRHLRTRLAPYLGALLITVLHAGNTGTKVG